MIGRAMSAVAGEDTAATPNLGADLRTEVHSVAALDGAIRNEWETLMRDSADPLLYGTHDWVKAWFDSFGRDKELILIIVRHCARLVGIAPLVRSRLWRTPGLSAHYIYQPEDWSFIRSSRRACVIPVRQLSAVANLQSVNMRNAWTLARGFELDGARAIFSHVQRLPGWDVLLLPSVRATEVDTLARAATEAGLRARRIPSVRSLYTMPVMSWEQYSQRRSRNFRSGFREAENRLMRLPAVEIATVTAPEKLPAVLDEMFKLARCSWKQHGRDDQSVHLPMTAEAAGFYHALCRRYAEKGGAQMMTLRSNGEMLACLFCLTEGDTLYALQTYYAPEVAYVSPGRFLIREMIRWCAAHGVARIDFNGNSKIVQMYTQEAQVYDQLLLFRPRGYSLMLYAMTGAVQHLLDGIRRRRNGRAEQVVDEST
jgi:CelD/BcsL family acetyltransferase involved in cellulose biosynthesis